MSVTLEALQFLIHTNNERITGDSEIHEVYLGSFRKDLYITCKVLKKAKEGFLAASA